jgi:hypothetical protein
MSRACSFVVGLLPCTTDPRAFHALAQTGLTLAALSRAGKGEAIGAEEREGGLTDGNPV